MARVCDGGGSRLLLGWHVDPGEAALARSECGSFGAGSNPRVFGDRHGVRGRGRPASSLLADRATTSLAYRRDRAGRFAANNFLYFEALHLTNVATALLLQYQAPVLVALYSVLVQRQPLRGRIILALALALVGCSLVVRAYDPEMLRPNLLGVMAGLGTACTFAFYILASRAALRSLDAWTLLAYGYFSASLFWSAVIPPWKILGHGFSLGVWITFLAIATVGTVLPFGLFIWGLKFLLPTQAGIVGMLEPVVAATAAFVVLGETLVPLQILGGGLVLAGVVMVQTT
jgi:drug/metabolite transporter (DMT)-like permease